MNNIVMYKDSMMQIYTHTTHVIPAKCDYLIFLRQLSLHQAITNLLVIEWLVEFNMVIGQMSAMSYHGSQDRIKANIQLIFFATRRLIAKKKQLLLSKNIWYN